MQWNRRALLFLLGMMAWPAAGRAQDAESAFEEAALARRGGGLRAGLWNVKLNVEGERSPALEGYLQRGLDPRLALESSIGVWRISTITTQATGDVETKSYVVPVLTSLKFYPVTDVSDRLEPFVMAGAGFALGIEDEAEAAIGGGGTSLVTGFGLKAAAGVQLNLGRALALSASAKYQWVRFGQEVGGEDTFGGMGFEGGLAYRFQL